MAEGPARPGMRRAFVLGVLCAALAPAMPREGRAAASDAEAVKAFLAAIFARAATGKEIDGRATYTPSLYAMLRRESRHEPCLESDPLLDCQDCGQITDVMIDVTSVSGGTAQAKVLFKVWGTQTEGQLTLKRVGAVWRIDEVSRPSMPSLQGYLKKCPA